MCVDVCVCVCVCVWMCVDVQSGSQDVTTREGGVMNSRLI